MLAPYQPQLNQRNVNRPRIALAGLGATNPVGAGSGAGAEIGATTGASVGTDVLPGVGTAVGAIVGAVAGAIAGAINKTDPENADFNEAVAIWQQNPNAIYSLGNPYLALAGLFDLNLTTNVPIYKKFGHMGELQFVLWLCNTVYQAAQAGIIGPADTALTVMSKVVQPAINSWGYGPMSDPHADLITRLIVTMILQYTEGAQGNWYAVGGQYPPQFNSIPPFSFPQAVPAQQVTPVATATQSAVTPTVLSPAGQAFVIGQAGSLVTPQGTWTQSGTGAFLLNGAAVTSPPTATQEGTVGLLYMNQQTYGYNRDGSTMVWDLGWVLTSQVPTPGASIVQAIQHYAAQPAATPAPPSSTSAATNTAANAVPQAPTPPTTLESSDGSSVTGPGTALETPAGTIVYLGPQAPGDPSNGSGYPVWERGSSSAQPVQVGYAAGMILANGGNLYAVTAQGSWFQWGSNAWQPLSAAPVLNGPAPTTENGASSPQSGIVTCATTATTTGAVVATSAAGDAITDSDIQDLITQMSSQNASAQQIYTAVLQELQNQGANVSSGVQSQVASQVAASLPPTTTAATSSNTGLYIVGGGLALLAAIYFMGHRKTA
jgi:hypothetical protein